jgi:prepilin-type N-terminal cleavage/methylation domain-containing protein
VIGEKMSASTRKKRHPVSRQFATAGFTLIEIMVVLALTLVMMSLFAVIFGMTGTFVTKQKGVGENDQSARILTTVLKTDLQARTMRSLAPFHPNMTNASLSKFAGNQRGYFYVSENDPTDDTDDVLQFTIYMGGGTPGLAAFNNPAAGTQLFGRKTQPILPAPWCARRVRRPIRRVLSTRTRRVRIWSVAGPSRPGRTPHPLDRLFLEPARSAITVTIGPFCSPPSISPTATTA